MALCCTISMSCIVYMMHWCARWCRNRIFTIFPSATQTYITDIRVKMLLATIAFAFGNIIISAVQIVRFTLLEDTIMMMFAFLSLIINLTEIQQSVRKLRMVRCDLDNRVAYLQSA